MTFTIPKSKRPVRVFASWKNHSPLARATLLLALTLMGWGNLVGAEPIEPGNLKISPSAPSQSWTAPRPLNPGESVSLTVNVEPTGKVDGKDYELQDKPTFSLSGVNSLWTKTNYSDNPLEFQLLNSGKLLGTHSVTVSAVWKEVLPPPPSTGEGGGAASSDPKPLGTIEGWASGFADASKHIFTWSFDPRLQFSDGQSPIVCEVSASYEGTAFNFSANSVSSTLGTFTSTSSPDPNVVKGNVTSPNPGTGSLKIQLGENLAMSEEQFAFARPDIQVSSDGIVIAPAGGSSGSGSRTQVTLMANSGSTEGTFTLEANNLANLEVYTTPSGKEKITLPHTWAAAELKQNVNLYLGTKPFLSAAVQDGTLKLSYKLPRLTGSSNTQLVDSERIRLMQPEINEVSFGGSKYWELKSDDMAAAYSAPHWKDINGDGLTSSVTLGERNYGVAYTCHTKPKIAAKFKINGASNLGTINIKGTGPDGLEIPETTASVTGDIAAIPLTETSMQLPNSVKFYNGKDERSSFKIEWKIRVGSGEWSHLGVTKHTVYVIQSGETPAMRQETLFDIACRSADGKSAPKDVAAGIWSRFATRKIQKVQAPDGVFLKFQAPLSSNIVTAPSLLSAGNGQCRAWGELLLHALKLHGIQSFNIRILPIIPGPEFFGENEQTAKDYIFTVSPLGGIATPKWDWQNTDSFGFPSPLPGGPPWQGVNNPPSGRWEDHALVSIPILNSWYDPSYGTGPYKNIYEWEDAMVEGYVYFKEHRQTHVSDAFLIRNTKGLPEIRY